MSNKKGMKRAYPPFIPKITGTIPKNTKSATNAIMKRIVTLLQT